MCQGKKSDKAKNQSKFIPITFVVMWILSVVFISACATEIEIPVNSSDSISHWIPLGFMLLIFFWFFVILPPIAKKKREMRKEKELEEFRDCVERLSMGCNKCGDLVYPRYISLGTGRHRSEELWKYICDNCGRSWKEYWPMGS